MLLANVPKRLFVNALLLMCLLAMMLPGCLAEPFDPVAAGELPRYIFFSKGALPGDPYHWRQSQPETFTAESLEEVVTTIGTRGSDGLKIGALYNFSILENPPESIAQSIRNLLAASLKTEVPVFIVLDGQNWWRSRADLWNWWDPDRPGYDPENRFNVEWADWGPEHAVKIGWRNWGKQFRTQPAQNILSPKVLAEYRNRYDVYVPIILDWYRSLPADKKWLFGGVKVGWEASTNVNAFYYPDGNRIFEQYPKDTSHDPTERDKSQGWTFGLGPLGHAAAWSAGIKKSGELTKGDTEEVVRRYLAFCSREVRKRGVPQHLIFTHQGGNYAPFDKHLSFSPAINDDSIPGWSFYSHLPADCGSLSAEMDAAGRKQWAAVEWWRGAPNKDGWREQFERTLSFKNCRLIGVYNWAPFRTYPAALAAVRELIAQAG